MAATVGRLQAVLSAETKDFDKAMGRSESRFKSLGKAAALGGVAVAAGAAYGFKKFAEEAIEAEKVTAQTNAVIKSTGGAANVTAGQVDKLATSLMRKSGVDDEQIKTGSNMLLTFTKIRNEVGKGNDIFDQATKATLDLSVAMGKDMQSSAILVGKALNDPIKGMTALGRAGIQFTADQKETITTLVESGKSMEAQKMILKELETQFGGSAEAAGKTFGGQVAIAKNELLNMGGEMVAKVLPTLAKFVTFLVRDVVPAVLEVVKATVDKLRPAFEAIASWVAANWPRIKDTITDVLEVVKRLIEEVAAVAARNWPKVQEAAEAVVRWYKQNLEPTIRSVVENLTRLWEEYGDEVLATARRVFGALEGVVRPLLNALVRTINTVLAVLRGDWQQAWEEIKGVPKLFLTAAAMAITGLGGIFWDAAKALGKAAMEGVAAGIDGLKDWLKGKFEDALNYSIIDAGKDLLKIRSPSQTMADLIGKPISEGVALGIIENANKMEEALRESVQRALDSARDQVSSATSELAATLSFGFAAKTGGRLTPAEKRLQAIEEARADSSLRKTLADAEAALVAARLVEDTKERAAAVKEAQRQISEAQQAILLDGLRKQAELERENLREREFFEQQHFNTRLTSLQNFLTSGEASAAESRERIQNFMKDFGIAASDLGELLGASYAEGLRKQIPAVVKAAKDLKESIEELRVIDTRAKAEQKFIDDLNRQIEIASADAKKKAAAAAAKTKKGDPAGVAFAAYSSSNSVGLDGANASLGPFAAAAAKFGLVVSSGLRSPAENAAVQGAPNSDHLYGRAIDVAGSSTGMAAFFRSLIGNSRVKQAFYDPLGSIFGGALSSYREGGHSDHVHVATYDRGGSLMPGWNLAYNGTGRPEAVGGGSAVFNVNVGGETLVQIVWDGMRRKAQVFERQNGRPAFGGGF